MIGKMKRYIFNMPIKWKFFLLTIFISVIPVSCIGIISYRISQEYLKESATESAIMKSEAINSRLERYLSNIDDTSLMLISNYYLQRLLVENNLSARYIYENEVRRAFSSILSSKNNIHSIVLYDNDGKLRVYETGVHEDGLFKDKVSDNITSNEMYDSVKELLGKRVWTKLYRDTDKISMIRVVNEIGSQYPVGTLVINLNEDNLHGEIQELDPDREGGFLVFEQNGNIIYSSGLKPVVPQAVDIPQKDSGYKVVNYKGNDYLNVYYVSKFCGWRMITLIPLKTLFMRAAAIKEITIVTIIVCFYAVIIFSILLTNFLTKPITKLSKLMRKVEEGDMEIRFESSYNDEIGQLGRNFTSMVEKTKLLLKENVEKQKRLRMQELKALQAQINPHFLYNTIDTINWMAQSIDADDISQIAIALANYYRLSLSKGAEIIKIGDEINQVKNYLMIQKIRYDSYLSYEFCVSDEILNLYIPKLTLQPIVENAIYHGIKDKLENGVIHISGKLEDDRVLFEIWDNGKGMDPEKLENVRKSLDKIRVEGFGLSNVNERIQLFFGEKYGITMDSMENIFTKVNVVIPAVDKQ